MNVLNFIYFLDIKSIPVIILYLFFADARLLIQPNLSQIPIHVEKMLFWGAHIFRFSQRFSQSSNTFFFNIMSTDELTNLTDILGVINSYAIKKIVILETFVI